MNDKEIVLKYFEVPDDLVKETLMMPKEIARSAVTNAMKKFIERQGATYVKELTPLDNWLKFIHELNGLPYTKPAHPAIADAISGNAEVQKMVFAIAGL